MPTPDRFDRLKEALAERYAVLRELGGGGMAMVYLAEDLKHHRKVAVKVLRPELAAALGHERFLREIEIAAQLQHPHILPLLDSGEADGFLYYVMPYVDGELAPRPAGAAGRAAGAGGGEAPVRDRGCARLRPCARRGPPRHQAGQRDAFRPPRAGHGFRRGQGGERGDRTAAAHHGRRGARHARPTWPPSRRRADPHLDHRVDIYAVGAMAYELLAGRPPFTGLSPQQVLAAHVTQPPEPITAHRPSISPALAAVVMKCLAKRSADRWQTRRRAAGPARAARSRPAGAPRPQRPVRSRRSAGPR